MKCGGVRGPDTLVRQTFTHGPGESGLRIGARSHPERASEIIQGRHDELAANMRTTLHAMESALTPSR
jgi:hypothetical protein